MAISNKTCGVLAALTVMCIWSGWLVLTRWGVTHSLTNTDILLLRFGTATFVILPFILAQGLHKFIGRFSWKTIIPGLACGIPYVWPSFIGLELSATANAGVIVNGSIPIFTLLIMYLMSRVTPVFVQFLGISLIVLGNVALLLDNIEVDLVGYFSLLFAGLSLSIYSVTFKIWGVRAEDIIVVGPIANFIFVVPIWLFSGSNIVNAPIDEILSQAIYQGVVVSLIALWLMSYSLKYISAYTFSFVMALVPFNAALMAHFILGEPFTQYVLIASALCTFGIIVFNANAILQKILPQSSTVEKT